MGGVIKNMLVRVGADVSGLISGMKQGGGATESFAKQTEKSLRNSSLSLGNLKKAMAQGGKNAAIVSITDQIRELEQEQKNAKAAGFSWGYEIFENNEATLRSLKQQLEDYKASLSDTEVPIDEMVQSLWESVIAADGLGAKLQQAKAALKAMESRGLGAGDEDWDRMYQSVTLLSREVEDYKHSLTAVDDETESVNQKTRRLGAAVRSTFGGIKNMTSKLIGAGKTSAGLERVVRSIRRIGIASLGLRFVKSIFGELRSVVLQYISENAVLQAQVTTLNSSLGQALGPAINVVVNALSRLMPYVVGVSNAIGSLISNLFGSGWTTVAEGANSAAGAISGAASAQKEMNRQLAGFDEITKLNATKDSGGGSSGTTTSTTAVAGKTPSWMSSLTQQIQESASNGDFAGIGAAFAGAINKGIKSLNLSDGSLGSKIAGAVNAGIEMAAGLAENIDWSGLGQAIAKTVSDAITGIDWTGAFELTGSLAGALSSFASVFGSSLFSSIFQSSSDEAEGAGENVFKSFLSGFATAAGYDESAKSLHVAAVTLILKVLKKFQGPIGKIISTALIDELEESVTESTSKNIGGGSFGTTAEIEIDATANFTTWKDSLKDKVSSFKAKFTTWKDSLKDKVSNFKANFTTWKDSLKDKVSSFKAKFTTWKDSLKDKVSSFKANFTTWKDSLKDKVSSFKAKFTTWKDSLKDKVSSFKAKFTTWKDSLKDKVSNFRANFTTWRDNLEDKTLEFAASIKKGWTGTLAKALGIEEISSQLKLKLPKISIDWGSVTIFKETFRYPKGFDVTWNATGAILNGAQIFGMAGNSFLGGGEAGREAVLPLDRNTWWMDKIADRVATRVTGGAQSGEQNITINLVVDGKKVASTVVKHVNAQAQATGTHPFAAYI